MNPSDLRARWTELKEREPSLRARDAAAKLGVSEAELVASNLGHHTVRLTTAWKSIVTALGEVGPVTGLSRNEWCVIEKTGRYAPVEIDGVMGSVLDEGIDLRLFLARWHVAFASFEETPRGVRRSVQIFDRSGAAIHKVFLDRESDVSAFERLVAEHTSESQDTELRLEPRAEAPVERPDADIDVAALRSGWAALTNTHEFFFLLRKVGATRTQALRLAPDFARSVEIGSHRTVLERSREIELPIMVFVGNPGILQIHSGPVRRLKEVDGWYNVLDPHFNLHLREEGIAASWVVEKPTADGPVTSLELYDAAGETIALLFSKRKPGQRESTRWSSLLAGLSARPEA
jgi:putative hemin transport protein